MGLLSGMLGNSSQVDPTTLQSEYEKVLLPGEEIQRAYQVIRDLFIFTSWRLIMVDHQGLTGSKVEYHSFPYKSITHFAVETAGTFDLDAELKIWISGSPAPIQKSFNRKVNVYDVNRLLAHFVLHASSSSQGGGNKT
jgi:hypothetical protein